MDSERLDASFGRRRFIRDSQQAPGISPWQRFGCVGSVDYSAGLKFKSFDSLEIRGAGRLLISSVGVISRHPELSVYAAFDVFARVTASPAPRGD